MITDVQAIFALTVLFVTVYFLGSRKNRKLMRTYAIMIRDHLSPYCKRIGFRTFRISGFRALCLPTEEERRFEKMEVTVALVDRENLLHYPLSLITRDFDRVTCWAFPRGKLKRIEIFPKTAKKLLRKATIEGLIEVSIEEIGLDEFVLFTSNSKFAKRLLSDSDVRSRISEVKDFLKRISFDEERSYISVLGELEERSLIPLLDLALSCCAFCQKRV